MKTSDKAELSTQATEKEPQVGPCGEVLCHAFPLLLTMLHCPGV